MAEKIDRLVINSPYEEPKSHWIYDSEAANKDDKFRIVEGRRKAGYFIAKPGAKAYDDEGRFIEIELVNRIRERVRQWREEGYPGITNTTRDLLLYCSCCFLLRDAWWATSWRGTQTPPGRPCSRPAYRNRPNPSRANKANRANRRRQRRKRNRQ